MTQDNHEPAETPADTPADDETVRVGPPPPPPPPPGAGFPPPGGFPPPPPGTGGWATRYGLVRPVRGRVFAGVCAAIGRATNTDPVLWRVIFAVLGLVGGVGIVAYLVGWMLIPSEGDTGSPLEALLGRGRSSTSPVIVVIVSIGVILAAGGVLFDSGRHLILLAVILAGAALLISRAASNRSGPVPPVPPAGSDLPPTPPYTMPAPPTTDPVDPASGGYRPPFAPYGPYASSPYPYPGLATAPPPPVPQAPPRPPSRLGRLTFSLTLLVLGVVALVDVIGKVPVPFAAYVAAALATVGLGLVIGAWFGRARGLIAFGIILSVVLAIATAAGHVHTWRGSAGDVNWQPANITQVQDRYEHGFGNAQLDLSQVDFTGQDKHITVRLNAGDLRVTVPPKVDVEVQAKVNVGNANVFDTTWNGVNTPQRTVTNDDTDGPGGGHLTLDIVLTAGDLEVTR
jgi:phage shock protein PspC (stress-responsive transcriptional regulator)